MNQFDTRRSGAALSSDERPRIPAEVQATHALESEYVTMRFTTTRVDDVEMITRLSIEATHPKVLGDSRVFDLSHILPEGYRRDRSTVAQIVDPNLSLDARLDALKTVAVVIAGVREPLPPINDVQYGARHTSTLDGLESTFAIKSVVLTGFLEILGGVSRRAVTVVRNEEPWVEFSITEIDGSLRDAWMVILPTGLEFPLLDQSGLPVTDATLDETIHDFTYLLRQGRYAPESIALEAVADELTNRLTRNPDPSPSLKGRDFRSEIALAARDHLIWSEPGERGQAHGRDDPTRKDLEARELPDGRVMWMRHRRHAFAWEMTIIVDSLEGARSELTFHYTPRSHQRVARAFAKAVDGTGWPRFKELVDLLRGDDRGGFSIVTLQGANTYPSAVTALMRDAAQALPRSRVEQGVTNEKFQRLNDFLPDFLGELVKGRSPFYTVIDNGDPAERWYVQAFFDRDLKGGLYAVNALGGSLTVHHDSHNGSPDFRRTRIVEFLNLLSKDSRCLLYDTSHVTGLRAIRRNLPDRSSKDALAYAAATHGVSVSWAALVKEWGTLLLNSPGAGRWETQCLKEGMWAVSLLSPFGRIKWFPYLITLKASTEGIVEVLYSRGSRDPLGGLLGRRVFDASGRALSDDELSKIIQVIARSAQGTLEMGEGKGITNVAPTLRRTFLSSLRRVDPERSSRDLLARLWSFVRNLW